MTYTVLISCPHMQRTIAQYTEFLENHEIQFDLPFVEQHLTEEELIPIIGKYDGVIAGDDQFTRNVLREAKNLKIISKWGIGIDGIDLKAAEEYGIPVTNTPNVFGDEVADQVMGYMILMSRHLHLIDRKVRDGLWSEAQITGKSLRGKTLGIIGVGSIGRAVGARAHTAGMELVGYDVYPIDEGFMAEYGLRQVELDELLSKSDYISLNCNLTPENRHMLGREQFEKMKTGVCIINTARGPLIDESALISSLKSGKVGGAALDVFEEEPLPMTSPLRTFQDVILGAHNSSNTIEAILRTNERAMENLILGLEGKK